MYLPRKRCIYCVNSMFNLWLVCSLHNLCVAYETVRNICLDVLNDIKLLLIVFGLCRHRYRVQFSRSALPEPGRWEKSISTHGAMNGTIFFSRRCLQSIPTGPMGKTVGRTNRSPDLGIGTLWHSNKSRYLCLRFSYNWNKMALYSLLYMLIASCNVSL